MTNKQEIERTLTTITEMERRRGRDFGQAACFQCGAEGPAEPCRCQYPESLRCAGKHLCGDCRAAHGTISVFLKELLRTQPSPNSHSRRAKLHLRLYRALDGLGPESENVRHFLAQTDGGDDNDKFRAVILSAFERARFLDFRALGCGIRRELDRELLGHLVRSIRLP